MSMNERQIKVVVGSLLHDVGKIIYRTGLDSRNHSESGYDFVKNELSISDTEILNCIRYHHGFLLRGADIPDNDICYLTYFADNIASAVDRRRADDSADNASFAKDVPLESVFNILNGNKEKKHYSQMRVDLDNQINYPTSDKVILSPGFYTDIKENFKKNLKGITLSEDDITSLVSLLEANLSYVPSSTNVNELVDIPLYDHLKLTACFASCMEAYLAENNEDDYKKIFLTDAEKTYTRNMFMLFSMDISGIQSFIYTISTDRALKQLRARSVYLEMLMEHLIDELLTQLNLSRVNLIYSGGGHCYMLLPNTSFAKKTITEFEKNVNSWFLKHFDVALYVGTGYAECCSDVLRNEPNGSYRDVFRNVSKMISAKKIHRYTADELRELNSQKLHGERECKVCRSVVNLNGEDRCPICASLEKMAKDIMKYTYFMVVSDKSSNSESMLPLPFGRYLVASSEKFIQKNSENKVRVYAKNQLSMGDRIGQNLWVGDYHYKDEFKELSECANGVKKIAVLRADVDNLGTTFVSGFKDKYATLTRSAVLSRQLSLFFKGYINKILSSPEKRYLSETPDGKLAVTIVYSGGDDVFLVGAWDSVFDAFINIKQALQKFTQGTLNISGGIGIYNDSFPISVMAREVAELEDCSKGIDGKNAITFFDESNAYKWDDFIKNVLEGKFDFIRKFMSSTSEKGNSFLYNILELLRNSDEKINIARLVYLLSRLEPVATKDNEEQVKRYREFADRLYQWAREKDISGCNSARQELISALIIYVILTRKNEVEGNGI